MKFVLIALLMLGSAACEKKPTEEEIAQKKAEELAKSSPKPKPGDWMYNKERGNPLEKKPK